MGYVANGRGPRPRCRSGRLRRERQQGGSPQLDLSPAGATLVPLRRHALPQSFRADPGQPALEADRRHHRRAHISSTRTSTSNSSPSTSTSRTSCVRPGESFSPDAAYALGVLHFGKWSPTRASTGRTSTRRVPTTGRRSPASPAPLFGVDGRGVLQRPEARVQPGRPPWGVEHVVVVQVRSRSPGSRPRRLRSGVRRRAFGCGECGRFSSVRRTPPTSP